MKLAPLLEQAVADGIMTREEAEAADRWAEDLAKAQALGIVTDDAVQRMIHERAVRDARAHIKRWGKR
jgi:hypothetical protein